MGVWGRGPNPNRVDVAGIAAAMRPALYLWFNAHVQIFRPVRDNQADFDPFADDSATVDDSVLVLDSGVNGALVQPLRTPNRVDVGDQANSLLGVRFQIAREVEPTEPLRGGLLVRVLDGGQDPTLTGYTFSLLETVDSSLAWGRIYEAVVVAGGSRGG